MSVQERTPSLLNLVFLMFHSCESPATGATTANELLRNCVAAKQSTNRAFDQYANTLQAVTNLGKCEIQNTR